LAGYAGISGNLGNKMSANKMNWRKIQAKGTDFGKDFAKIPGESGSERQLGVVPGLRWAA